MFYAGGLLFFSRHIIVLVAILCLPEELHDPLRRGHAGGRVSAESSLHARIVDVVLRALTCSSSSSSLLKMLF